ncbi:MAG: chemotaxis-specific protein-glutamate methyltransferase CheB [Candidatus Kapabacteria bacterium]|nr:chemotaxis-specific protein-glutamate methyltransferase CheB [Candidatus Kapabacteria bacterium]
MRIAIVNDVALEIEILRRSLNNYSGFEVAWLAHNGKEALEEFAKDKPDLILMNLSMPVMDGAAATKAIMEISPVAVLLVTSSVSINQAKVFEAMGYGALDVVRTPVLNSDGEIVGADELIKKINIFKKLINYHKTVSTETPNPHRSSKVKRTRIVAIGSSTGGPKALSVILSQIPRDTKAAFIVIQHVDSQFATGLAEWLRNYSNLPLHLAESGISPENGNVYIANTDDHLFLNSHEKFEYTAKPLDNHFRPSVDVFFKSLTDNWSYKDIAVLLTGMGYDGAKGLLELKKNGWYTIAQDEATSIVYGMPKVASEMGAALEILPIEKIAESIIKNLNKRN